MMGRLSRFSSELVEFGFWVLGIRKSVGTGAISPDEKVAQGLYVGFGGLSFYISCHLCCII